jgi:exonuclease SbcC
MQKTSIQSLEKKKFDNANLLLDLKEKIKSNKEKIKKITDFKEEFPIESLTESLEEQRSIKTNVLQVKATCEKEKINLENQLRSIAHLSEVPCGDKFPTCKFIKDSYNNQSLLEGQYRIIESLEEQIVTFEKLLTRLKKDKLEEKIKKYNLILNQEMSLQSIHNHLNFEIKKMKDDRVSIAQKIKEGKVLLEELKTNVVDADIDTKILLLKSQIQTITDEISQTDAKRISLAESAGKLESKLTNLRGEKLKFKALKDELKLYDLFINAVSKKGIPLQIILSQLPAINVEISKILQGVVGFTVDLEADPNSNQMDIYINYGDSKRVIELASGMEKMMASLAIRVALINVSSLPKTDLLVIDEGFGALDEMNVESCNRLLISLKRWFRNILVISHVDAVKDVVDNVIDITHKGKNAKVYVE